MKQKILIVEDQLIEAGNMKAVLREAGYTVIGPAGNVRQAIGILQDATPDLVLLDIDLGGEQTGVDLATELNKKSIAFVYLSAYTDRVIFERAKATQPYGYLTKPFRKKDVLAMIEIALYLHAQKKKFAIAAASASPVTAERAEGIVGESPAIKEVLKRMSIVGPSEVSTLIIGESGTGKELVAEGIHRLSGRRDKPLIMVNCAVLPPELAESELFGHEKGSFTGAADRRIGKFEQAEGGTIFLDEIGELQPNLQAKFLRVLQSKQIEPIGGRSKKVDVRVIAATNRNLEEEIVAGRFRLDLYYRLNVFPLVIPALRHRKEDIPLLAMHFLDKFNRQESRMVNEFTDAVLKDMVAYQWPGNVRELENFVARSVLMATGTSIKYADLPVNNALALDNTPSHGVKTMAEQEKDHIIAALKKCNWKLDGKGGAAELLRMNASTLRSRIKKLGIDKAIRSRE